MEIEEFLGPSYSFVKRFYCNKDSITTVH